MQHRELSSVKDTAHNGKNSSSGAIAFKYITLATVVRRNQGIKIR